MSTVGYFDKRHQFRPLQLDTPNRRFRSYKKAIHKESDETNKRFGTSFIWYFIINETTSVYDLKHNIAT